MSLVWSLVTIDDNLALTLNLRSIREKLKLEKAMKSFRRKDKCGGKFHQPQFGGDCRAIALQVPQYIIDQEQRRRHRLKRCDFPPAVIPT